MIEYLDQIDKSILIALNGNGVPYWDHIMWIFTGRMIWIPVVIAYLSYFFRKGGWREALFVLLSIALLITLCDQIASSFFKPYFARLRPPRQEELKGLIQLVNGYTSGMYGFISSHASNSIGFAVFSALLIKNRYYSLVIYFWALVTCYTRIYLGVHFPGDVLVGGLVGALCGIGVYYLYESLHRYLYEVLGFKHPQSPYLKVFPVEPVVTLLVIFVILLTVPTLIYPFFI